MVASIAPMTAGIETYYTDLAREDYYLSGGEPPGVWIGEAAKSIGLQGEIGKEQLSQVLAGFGIDGEKLVRNAGAENRQVGWDVTFSAPKDVSVIWGIGNEEQRNAIEEAHNIAVEVAIDFLQKNAMWSRTGKGGTNWQQAQAVVATFLHGTSRDVDPNLHTHALFANVGVRGDGTTGTIVSKKLYQNKMVAGLIYRAALAETLNQDLGFELEQVESWFQIKGFSNEARDFFSKRRNAIEEQVGSEASAAEKDHANLRTRQVKGHVARNDLYPQWQDQSKQFGLDQEYVDNLFATGKKRTKDLSHAKEACQESIDALSETEGFFNKTDFLRSTLSKLQTGKLDVDSILKECDQALQNDKVSFLGKDASLSDFFTTQNQIEVENEILDSAKEMIDKAGMTASKSQVEKVLEGSSLSKAAQSVEAFFFDKLPKRLQFKFTSDHYQKLNKEQKDAVYQITSEQGLLKTVSGRAGTGKTTMLAAAKEVWESQGLKVVGCSVSGKAAQELASGAGINSETVAMRLLQLEKSAWKTLQTEARQLMRAFLGKNRLELEKLKLDKKSVLVVDEASMLESKQLKSLLEHAKKAGSKVVLVGDVRQLPSISAGGGFAKLFKETAGVELTEVLRQKTKWLNQAVTLFAEGDSRGALTEFAQADRLNFGGDQLQVQENLIADWDKNRAKDLKQTVILAPTNKDVDELNQKAQDIRRREGELGKSQFVWGETKYYEGDRIAFHANNRKLGVWNGDRGTIKAIVNPITSFAVRFIVELDRGETITFCPRELKTKETSAADAMSLGYASTIHKSQGMTVDKSFLMLDSKRASKELAYVGLTRSRLDASIHCQTRHVQEDVVQYQQAKEELERTTSRSLAKQMATERQRKMEEERRIAEEQKRKQQLAHGHTL